MNRRLTIVLIGIVVLPLAIVGWLVGRTVQNERAIAEQQFRELARFRLQAIGGQLEAVFDKVLADLTEALRERPLTTEQRRVWADGSLVAKQLYVVSSQGTLLHPPIADPVTLTPAERESLRRTEMIWDEGALTAEVAGRAEQSSFSTAAGAAGWFTWYWGGGVRWIAWWRDQDAIYAVELDRVRMLSEIVNALPATQVGSDELASDLLRLTDSSENTIYQWGQLEPAEGAQPVARVAATGPLSAWALEYHASATAAAGVISRTGPIAGMLALIVAMTTLAIYLYREQTRSLREAGQRVSFVNQVSHELKTPLTNIRMYAELMSDNAGEEAGPNRRRLDVIVAESQRLSRLITNVLTLSGRNKRPIELRPEPTVLDDVVRAVVDSFRPALESKSIETRLELDAAQPVTADPDRLEQIVGNLVSNVEKYAADGGFLGIATRVVDGRAQLDVEDRGRGISEADARRIFEPFYRAGSSLTDGVSGTGIGLSIARDLARLHGGDLSFKAMPAGSRFRLDIPLGSERA